MGTTDKECDATNTSASQSLDATRHKGVDSLEPLLVWHVIGFVKDAQGKVNDIRGLNVIPVTPTVLFDFEKMQ